VKLPYPEYPSEPPTADQEMEMLEKSNRQLEKQIKELRISHIKEQEKKDYYRRKLKIAEHSLLRFIDEGPETGLTLHGVVDICLETFQTLNNMKKPE